MCGTCSGGARPTSGPCESPSQSHRHWSGIRRRTFGRGAAAALDEKRASSHTARYPNLNLRSSMVILFFFLMHSHTVHKCTVASAFTLLARLLWSALLGPHSLFIYQYNTVQYGYTFVYSLLEISLLHFCLLSLIRQYTKVPVPVNPVTQVSLNILPYQVLPGTISNINYTNRERTFGDL